MSGQTAKLVVELISTLFSKSSKPPFIQLYFKFKKVIWHSFVHATKIVINFVPLPLQVRCFNLPYPIGVQVG